MADSTQLVISLIKLNGILLKAWRTLRWCALLDLLVVLAVALSFLFTRDFSAIAFSDRLFMAGIAVLGLGVLVVFSLLGVNQDFWKPFRTAKEYDGQKILEASIEQHQRSEKRYNLSSLLSITGMGCLLLSIISYLLLTGLGIGT